MLTSTLPLLTTILLITAAGDLIAQAGSPGAPPPDTTTARIDTAALEPPDDGLRHSLYLNSGYGIPFSRPKNPSTMMEYRYDHYGITFGRVDSDAIPGISTGVPSRSAPVTRFRKQVVGIDLAHFFKVGEKLSLYASIGYYWNDYLDLALASDNRSYQWVDRGSEKRLALGVGLQFEFHPEHMHPNTNIMLGIGVHSYRGPVVMIGFVKRFNWP